MQGTQNAKYWKRDYKAQPYSTSMNSYRFDFNVKKKKRKCVLLSWRWRPVSHSRPLFTIQHLIRYGVTLVGSFAGAAARLVTVRLLGPVGCLHVAK